MEPTALERCTGGGLVVKVAAHDVVPAHGHLAHRGPVTRDVVHLIVDDTDEIGGDVSLALASQEFRALLYREFGPALRLGAHGDRAVGLGQAVHVHDVEVQLAHPAQQRR
jgi:hypothetical protein